MATAVKKCGRAADYVAPALARLQQPFLGSSHRHGGKKRKFQFTYSLLSLPAGLI